MITTDTLVNGVKEALDKTTYGKIKVKLRDSEDKDTIIPITVEKRTRFLVDTPQCLILDAVRTLVDNVYNGTITIELRGKDRPLDIVTEYCMYDTK